MEKTLGETFDIETIEKLAAIVHENHLEEITLTLGETRITVRGQKNPPPPHHHHPPHDCPPPPPGPGCPPPPFPPHMGMPPFPPKDASSPAPPADEPSSAPKTPGKAIKSPLVGTFYAASSPDAKPFVQVGDRVEKGDTIFIIESMKLMNEVQSDMSGTVSEILVKNGDPVEYDQPLMILT